MREVLSMAKFLVIGAGAISQSAHIPNLLRLGETIVGVVDRNFERAQRVAKQFGIPRCWDDYSLAISSSGVDGVIVATPTKFHYPITMAALRAGKHVLCEKPPAMTAAEAYEMAKEAERRGLILMYGLHRRFRDDALAAKEAIERGELGEVYFARARWIRSRGAPGGWFCQKALAGGGPLYDIGVHAIDLGWWLLGKPKVRGVYGFGFYRIGSKGVDLNYGYQPSDVLEGLDRSIRFDVEDYAGGFIVFEGGQVLSYEVSWLLNDRDDFRVTVCGTERGVSFPPLEFYEGNRVVFDGREEGEAHFRLTEEFVRAVSGGRQELRIGASGWDGYELMVMLERASQFLQEAK
jgi:predicted dehydrogenase